MKKLFALFLVLPVFAQAKLKIAATTTDLEYLAQVVGADQVETFSVAKGTQDPHQLEAKPSFMVKFRDADLVLSHGLELENAWLDPLIQGSRNTKIKPGMKGNLDLGSQLDPINVQKGTVSRADGDVHPEGNPHFQLDPIRMGKAAVILASRLGDLDESHRVLYLANANTFAKDLESKTQAWTELLKKSGIKEFVSYHKTLSYFASRFGLQNSLQLEPKPGIPPTAAHVLDVIAQMKKRQVKVVLIENFYDDSVRSKILKEIPDARIVKVPVSIGGTPNVKTTAELVETLVTATTTVTAGK